MSKTVCVSGGFDPIHAGHVRMIRAAKKIAGSRGKLIVILNSDEWLMRKKGYVFMPFREKLEILLAMSDVDAVSHVDDSDGTVRSALLKISPDVFANGGDRGEGDIPEEDICQKLGIDMVYNVGGGKIQSSSELVSESLGVDIPSSEGVSDE